MCYGVSAAEKRLHTTILFPSPFLSRPVAPYCTPPLLPSPFSPPPDPAATPCPFAFWLRSGTGAREGSFALSRGRESRVTVCRVCMGISQVHGFLRERRTSSPGRTFVRYVRGVRGGRVGERKRIGDYMTMMAILKHNILCGTRKRDVGRQYDGGR